jgi:hypothetical protein
MKYLIINGAGSSIDVYKDFPDGRKLLEILKDNYDTNGIIKKHNPSSIDLLMTKIIDQNHHKDLIDRVKAAISNIIFEAQSKISSWNNNYFFDIIQSKILIDNVHEIDVVNFNYDTVLEKTVESLISIYESDADGNEERKSKRIKNLKDLLERLKNSHVYGYIGDGGKHINFIREALEEKTEEFISKIKN